MEYGGIWWTMVDNGGIWVEYGGYIIGGIWWNMVDYVDNGGIWVEYGG